MNGSDDHVSFGDLPGTYCEYPATVPSPDVSIENNDTQDGHAIADDIRFNEDKRANVKRKLKARVLATLNYQFEDILNTGSIDEVIKFMINTRHTDECDLYIFSIYISYKP